MRLRLIGFLRHSEQQGRVIVAAYLVSDSNARRRRFASEGVVHLTQVSEKAPLHIVPNQFLNFAILSLIVPLLKRQFRGRHLSVVHLRLDDIFLQILLLGLYLVRLNQPHDFKVLFVHRMRLETVIVFWLTC